MSDVLKHSAPDSEESVKLLGYMVSLAYGIKPIASIKISVNAKEYTGDATGDGQYDAFVKALRQIYLEKLGRTLPHLLNYAVTIPPGGRTDALVQTVITWQQGSNIFRTRSLDADQTQAAINATFKMLNIIEKK